MFTSPGGANRRSPHISSGGTDEEDIRFGRTMAEKILATFSNQAR